MQSVVVVMAASVVTGAEGGRYSKGGAMDEAVKK